MKGGYGVILRSYGITPKKHLGQHFMTDPGLLRAVASAMVPGSSWVALEIGAGPGVLTREIAQLAGKVYAVEIDRTFEGVQARICSELTNITWIWGDALKQDLSGQDIQDAHPGFGLVLCGNLPYYITSEVLYASLIKRPRWKRMAFVVQEEVARRMAAPGGTRDFSRLSLWCQYRANVCIERRISRGAFFPPPDVQSCLVSLELKNSFPLDEPTEEFLDTVSRAAFSARRKTILNGLGELADKNDLLEIMERAGIDPRKRPEALGVEEFAALAERLRPVYLAKQT